MLLFDEQPIVFDRTLAREIGDRHATMLQRIHYWVEINRKNANKHAFKCGYYWTYKSLEKWHSEDFDYLSLSTVRRTLEDLIKKGYLITGEYNKLRSDRTKWYRVNKEKIEELYNKIQAKKQMLNNANANIQNEQMQESKMESSEMFKMDEPLHKNNIRINNMNNISYHSSSNNIIYSESEQVTDERLNDKENKNISSRKKYNRQYFKDSFGYSRVSKDKQEEVDKWITYAVDVCLKIPSEEIRIGMLNITAGELRDRLLELRYEHINNVLSKLNPAIKVSNHKNYILFILYNAKEQYESSLSTGSKPASKFNNKYVAPTPEYLEKRINNRGKTGERVVTQEDEDAYVELMKELSKGKEQEDVQ